MWLKMMIVHHEGARVTAEQILRTTDDPEVEQLAQEVVDGQTTEIASMQQFLAR